MSIYFLRIIAFCTASITIISTPQEKKELETIQAVVRNWKKHAPVVDSHKVQPVLKQTQTELQKKETVTAFLKKRECTQVHIPLLRKWDHTHCNFLLANPEFPSFIEDLATAGNARGLHLLAATLDKAGIALSTSNPQETDHAFTLQKKSLQICQIISRMNNVEPEIRQAIRDHVCHIRHHEPVLMSYYRELRAINNPKIKHDTLFPRDLGWRPKDTSLSTLEPMKAPDATVQENNSPHAKKLLITTESPVVAEESLETLEKRYRRFNKTGKQIEAVNIAWQIAKRAPHDSSYFKNARAYIEQSAQKNYAPASCILCCMDKHDPEKSIQHFLKAQTLRMGTLISEPEKTDTANTLISLCNLDTDLIYASDSIIGKEAIETILSFSKTHAQSVRKALAAYHYKNAFSNPTRQLICLKTARDLAVGLPQNYELIPGQLTVGQLNNHYCRQLYIFARNTRNYIIKDTLPLSNLVMATNHLAHVVKESNSHRAQALASLKKICLFIKTMIDKNIDETLTRAKANFTEAFPNISRCLLMGADGIPLGLHQRTTIADFLRTSSHPFAYQWATGAYEDSPYRLAALNSGACGSADQHCRMLFAIDHGNYQQARTLAQEGMRAKIPFAETFFKSMLFMTDVLKTDDLKLTAIKSGLAEIQKSPNKASLTLYGDALSTLERMRQRNFLPAFAPLLEQYCTEYRPESTQKLLEIIAEAQTIFNQKPAVEQKTFLNEPTLQMLSDYCVNNDTMDPLYHYAKLVLQTLKKPQPDNDEVILYQTLLRNISEHFVLDFKTRNKMSPFLVATKSRLELIESLESILADNKMVAQLRKNKLHENIVKLYFLFNPRFNSKRESID